MGKFFFLDGVIRLDLLLSAGPLMLRKAWTKISGLELLQQVRKKELLSFFYFFYKIVNENRFILSLHLLLSVFLP